MSESFWDFSIRTYQREGVADACLQLQSGPGVDVNMLLFTCWFGLQRGKLEHNLLEDLYTGAERWAERVVRPLRGARSWMKKDALEELALDAQAVPALREKIKSNELAAEKIEQEYLESMVAALSLRKMTAEDRLKAVLANIDDYFRMAGIRIQRGDTTHLEKIIMAADDNFSGRMVSEGLAALFRRQRAAQC